MNDAMTVFDRKGIISFLAITFGITYAIEGALSLAGVRFTGIPPAFAQFIVAGVMWVPALATVLTVTLVTKEGFGTTNLRFGSWKPYLSTVLIVPAGFAVTYALTWLLGLGDPDWQLTSFKAFLASEGGRALPLPPSMLLPVIFVVSVFAAPLANSIFGFGEEFGWRGYLLPKLMPLGKFRAYVISGVVWGLWHAPLVLMGFNYPGYPLLGIIAMSALTTVLGIFINEMSLRHRSSILAGWIHGVFNSQFYGIWRLMLFPKVNPLIGGMTGVVGVTVWSVIGLWVLLKGPRRLPEQKQG
jgi:membrane protease YdiL (CAAX protease family)